jgi:hypothetical protein
MHANRESSGAEYRRATQQARPRSKRPARDRQAVEEFIRLVDDHSQGDGLRIAGGGGGGRRAAKQAVDDGLSDSGLSDWSIRSEDSMSSVDERDVYDGELDELLALEAAAAAPLIELPPAQPNAAQRVAAEGVGPPLAAAVLNPNGRPMRPMPAPPRPGGAAGQLFMHHRFVSMAEMVGEDDIELDDADSDADSDVGDGGVGGPAQLGRVPRSACFLCQFEAFPTEYTHDEAAAVAAMQAMIETEVDENGADDRQIAQQVWLLYRHAVARPALELGRPVMRLTARQALAHIRHHRSGSQAETAQMLRENKRMRQTLVNRLWEERPDDSEPRINPVNVTTWLKLQTQGVNLLKASAALRKVEQASGKGRAALTGLERVRALAQFRSVRPSRAWMRGTFSRQRLNLVAGAAEAGERRANGPVLAGTVQR